MDLDLGMSNTEGWSRPVQGRVHFNNKIGTLDISVKAETLCAQAGITYIGELVQMTERNLFHTKILGRHCISDLREALAELGLSLNMDVQGWTPPTS